jgi:hypothetical protein
MKDNTTDTGQVDANLVASKDVYGIDWHGTTSLCMCLFKNVVMIARTQKRPVSMEENRPKAP